MTEKSQRSGPGHGRDEPNGRLRVFQLLRASRKPLDIAGISDRIDLHPNTIRFHLDTLIRAGRVEPVGSESTRPGRPAMRYRAIKGMDPDGPTNYLLLTQILLTYLSSRDANPGQTATELGRQWGHSLVATEPGTEPTAHCAAATLANVMGSMGFSSEPIVTHQPTQLRIRHCPFHEAVATHGTVICQLHLGLMQGVLANARAPISIGSLQPFAEPDLCIAEVVDST